MAKRNTKRSLRATVEQIFLSSEDFDRFVKILKNPPKPNAALKKAFKEYGKHVNGKPQKKKI